MQLIRSASLVAISSFFVTLLATSVAYSRATKFLVELSVRRKGTLVVFFLVQAQVISGNVDQLQPWGNAKC